MCDCSNESNFITHSMRTAWLSSALKINFCLLTSTGIVLHLYRNEILLCVMCDVCVWASLLLNVFHWLCLFLACSIRYYMRTVVEALKYLNKFLIRNFLFFSFLPQNFPPKRVSAFTFFYWLLNDDNDDTDTNKTKFKDDGMTSNQFHCWLLTQILFFIYRFAPISFALVTHLHLVTKRNRNKIAPLSMLSIHVSFMARAACHCKFVKQK